jgi:acetyl-CoA carboxylase alpha subunit
VEDAAKASDAAEALGITAHRLKALGLVDKIVNEPVGGAHRDPKHMATASSGRWSTRCARSPTCRRPNCWRGATSA